MSADIFQNKEAYLQNTYFQNHKREHGDFTPFYITITICTLLFVFIIVLNVTLGCCSQYSAYWVDRHTGNCFQLQFISALKENLSGNRWIVSLWTATPHKQPALDYTELEYVTSSRPQVVEYHLPVHSDYPPSPPEYPPAQLQYSKEAEAFELQKRESAI